MSKNIYVTEENREIIEGRIAEAQRGCSVRKIGYDDIAGATRGIERHLGIAKSRMVGVKADVDPHAQHFAKSYTRNYRPPQSTQFTLEYKRAGWALIRVYRDDCHQYGTTTQLHLTDSARAAVIERAERRF